jgi:hypothetical protein
MIYCKSSRANAGATQLVNRKQRKTFYTLEELAKEADEWARGADTTADKAKGPRVAFPVA